ncbi:MAG: hypothetical protein OXC08_18805 [Thiotrichales bacterium]|nr:hypothetical protein [Thiotrichales bacterium]
MIRSTHTFVELAVSDAVYDEIASKLREAGYDHAFVDGAIDMHGIGFVRETKEESSNGEFGDRRRRLSARG